MRWNKGVPGHPWPLVAILLLAILAYSLLVEPYNILVTENRFDLFEGEGELLKVVLISDTQGAYDHPAYFRDAISRVNREKPDIILIAGDIVDGEPEGWKRLGELERLESGYGTYAVLGNHDYRDWDCSDPAIYDYAGNVEHELESYGIDVLRNENRVLDVRGRGFAVVGIDDHWACRSDPGKAIGNLTANLPKIVLVHEQEVAYGIEKEGKTISLHGHTHCGQLYFPFITDYLTAYLGFGSIRQGRATLPNGIEAYVTCGLAPGGIRLFARPEISVIYLE